MRILLIDDKRDVLDTMGEVLELCHNHKVQGAESGKEALKFLRRNKYDLIVVDLGMPVMNGVEVIKRIRKRLPEVHIVVLTGIPCTEALLQQLDELSVEKTFRKPRGIQDLLLYIKQLAKEFAA